MSKVQPTKRTQFSMVLVNRRGELAKLSKALAEAKVNMEALSLTDGVHTGVAKVVVDNPEAAKKALKAHDLHFHVQEVFVISLPNSPGALAELSQNLADEDLSIDYIYGSACGCKKDCGCESKLVISTSSLKAATELAEAMSGWPRT